MPRISVLLPVYNAESTVGRAVQSILEQTAEDFELIVVDDGSTDATPLILQDICDSRLQCFRQTHAGVVAAANLATRLSDAPLLARMDADDWAHPERLRRQLQWLERRSLDVVGAQVRIPSSDGNRATSWQRYAQWINHETLTPSRMLALRFVEFPLVNPTLLARRAYFDLGFQDGVFPEDYDLMLRAARAGMQFGKVDQVLLEWNDGPQRLSRNHPRYSAAAFDRCRRHHLRRGPLADVEHLDLWGVAQTGKPWLRWFQEQSIGVRYAYDLDDRKVSQRIHGVEIRHADQLAPADGTPLVIAVGAAGARDVIRPQLQAAGYEPGRDAWFVA